jgi:SLAP domain-containing protein
MLKLVYHPTWDKALSSKDRELIEQVHQTVFITDKAIQFTPIRWDRNHKNELLLIVLIHNNSDEAYSFKQKRLSFLQHNNVIANHLFDLPYLTIRSKTAMPWTFIFPVNAYNREKTFTEGTLVVTE